MMAIFAGPAGAAAEAGDGALGIEAAAVLAWARALTPNPDARMQTNVNERFMWFLQLLRSLIEIARFRAEACSAS